jgi:UDP-N-acetylmuramyl pentapeptide synthase
MPENGTRRFPDAVSACEPVLSLVGAGDLVLVKGSRGTRMDVIVDALAAGRTR